MDKCTERDGKVYNEHGEVAVLISPGFGAGWSTWAAEHREAALFHPATVLWVLGGKKGKAPDVEWYAGGGWKLEFRWLAPGTLFCVDEYDGSETLVFSEEKEWTEA